MSQQPRISLVATGTWLSCPANTKAQAAAVASAANHWAASNRTRLAQCPFEEHIPPTGFSVSFVAAEFQGRWGCYCDCSWILESSFRSVHDATLAADKYCDPSGVSPLVLESIVFQQRIPAAANPDELHFYIFAPELCVYCRDGKHLDIYRLSGGVGAVTSKKIEPTRTLGFAQ